MESGLSGNILLRLSALPPNAIAPLPVNILFSSGRGSFHSVCANLFDRLSIPSPIFHLSEAHFSEVTNFFKIQISRKENIVVANAYTLSRRQSTIYVSSRLPRSRICGTVYS